MAEKKICVHRFPGFTDDTCPREFDLEGKTIEVMETVENWVEGEGSGKKHFFKIKGDDNQLYTICFDKKKNGWFCL
ncbi:hypothetical protein DESUT3_01050 [Desulfuromonas versatilis]|uniref:Cytoplasmic protein n=1 Tax=Desulfuromonas versatilis TaxID=2802975 RepID=A0ABN6DSM9_9BACT|nr:hypothetical protein [Desulfuromonas versatilis]BCR03036.1 hypothetical protein DESUT3_01050 [Desulfuromonas versatilis]